MSRNGGSGSAVLAGPEAESLLAGATRAGTAPVGLLLQLQRPCLDGLPPQDLAPSAGCEHEVYGDARAQQQHQHPGETPDLQQDLPAVGDRREMLGIDLTAVNDLLEGPD